MPDAIPDSNEQKRPLLDDPRVPLAAERTFLAWIRTGLALMGFGFVVARFGLFLREIAVAQGLPASTTHGISIWLGTALVIMGVWLNLGALVRYRRYLKQLERGIMPRPQPRLETAVAIALGFLGVGAVLYLLITSR